MKELAYFVIIMWGWRDKRTMGFVVVIPKPNQGHNDCFQSGVGRSQREKEEEQMRRELNSVHSNNLALQDSFSSAAFCVSMG